MGVDYTPVFKWGVLLNDSELNILLEELGGDLKENLTGEELATEVADLLNMSADPVGSSYVKNGVQFVLGPDILCNDDIGIAKCNSEQVTQLQDLVKKTFPNKKCKFHKGLHEW